MTEQLPPAVPAPAPTQSDGKKGLAIASLILGILSLCSPVSSIFPWIGVCGGLISIAGIILGALGLKSSKGMAVAGIILSVIGLLLLIVFIVLRVISGPIISQIESQILSGTGY